MSIPYTVLMPVLFPLLSILVLRKWNSKRRTYIVSGMFLFLSALIFLNTDSHLIQGRVAEVFVFPLDFYTGDPYAVLARFAFALTGGFIMAYISSDREYMTQIVGVMAVSSAILITLAKNFLTLLLFWEILTLTTAGLIFLGRTHEARRSGWRYILTHLAGGLLFLLGILINYQKTGEMIIQTPKAGLFFFVLAIGIKTAFVPFHFWLPTGYPAATFRGSVLLSALSTKAGVYAMARILPPMEALAYMGGIMALFGVVMALLQKKMRPLLSYHIISQVGYMVAGVALGTQMSVDGGLLHLFNHMLYKALLFMSAGAVIYATGKEHFKDLGGLYRRLPVATLAGFFGSLAIAGIPPFNGFISKTLLKYAVEGDRVLALMLLGAGIGTALSFSKFMYFGFFAGRIRDDDQGISVSRIPFRMQLPMLLLSALLLVLGIFPRLIQPLVPYVSETNIYSTSSVRDGLLFGGLGVVGFIMLRPLLDPQHTTGLHRFLHAVNEKIDIAAGRMLDCFKKWGKQEEKLNMGNIMWVFLYALTMILTTLIVGILF